MSILKNIQKSLKTHHIVILVGAVILIFALYGYSSKKTAITDNMTGSNDFHVSNEQNLSPEHLENNINGMNNKEDFAPINEKSNEVLGNKEITDPSELLPKDENSEWSKLNPTSSKDMMNVNLLKSGWMSGINTVGSSLRNANLQLRSEPPNPREKVGPWNNTTIEPDLMRTPLELGSHKHTMSS